MEASDSMEPCLVVDCKGTLEIQWHCGVSYVECSECNDQGPLAWTEGEARQLWNERYEKVMRAALNEVLRPANPCDKIFDHKWLDPHCVQNGCRSLIDKEVITQLQAKVRNLTKFYDDHVGTPCEQIRHAQQIQELTDALKAARQSMVLGVAFIGRDQGTERMPKTITGVADELIKGDKAILEILKRYPDDDDQQRTS